MHFIFKDNYVKLTYYNIIIKKYHKMNVYILKLYPYYIIYNGTLFCIVNNITYTQNFTKINEPNNSVKKIIIKE